ncbi:hypothetical protein LCL97_03440 [Seohaeicola saemankumensis]|nr:hypothetical protein [Seohaeicola saemankumensis]MCA0869867.1 hypothetical protein [Seohaeicola saemankumensis]
MFQSVLVVRVHPGQGPDAMRQFRDRGVLSECAEAIPGFIDGQLRAWGAHPARTAQLADLGHLIVQVELGDVFGPVFEG